MSTFLPPVAVPVETADQLHQIAAMQGQTVASVVRGVLAGYARGYLDYLRSLGREDTE